MLTEDTLYDMVKTAGTIKYSCGHTGKCRCSSDHVTDYDVPCHDCRCKQAALEEEEKDKTPGKAILNHAKRIGDGAAMVGGAVAGGVASLGNIAPVQQMNPRY